MELESEEQYYNEVLLKIKTKTRYEGNCWIFTGTINGNGYGVIGYKGNLIGVHRLICSKIHNKDLNDSKWVTCHSVECKHKTCWNPDHLRPGTDSDNSKDEVRKGTHHFITNNPNINIKKTTCPRGHPYDAIGSGGRRFCRKYKAASMKITNKIYKAKMKLKEVNLTASN